MYHQVLEHLDFYLILFCGSTVNLVVTSEFGWSKEKYKRFLRIGKTCILTHEWFLTKSIILF